MKSFRSIGQKVYDISKGRERRRYYVFLMRCLLNKDRLQKIDDFFQQNELLSEIAEIYPFVYEQPTRAFFYNKSTFEERAKIVEEHMEFMTENFRAEIVKDLYKEKRIPLWETECDEQRFSAELFYHPGQRKEGLMTVTLFLGDDKLYQMMFWFAKNRSGEWSLYIGAMQGPNMKNSRDVIKKITKKCHGFRTKNLVLYVTQAVARAVDIKHIYAVTNYGYYANNHVRMDRKLKTDFSDFWIEAGGHSTEDNRFDELPLIEPRKTMEEVPTRKRAVYRKRFAMLDEIDAAAAENMQKMMKGESANG